MPLRAWFPGDAPRGADGNRETDVSIIEMSLGAGRPSETAGPGERDVDGFGAARTRTPGRGLTMFILQPEPGSSRRAVPALTPAAFAAFAAAGPAGQPRNLSPGNQLNRLVRFRAA
jgi:hypothetical protein